ncbi:polysaccharide biosynthesis C-terminal domain-containing protein [Dietzia maris]
MGGICSGLLVLLLIPVIPSVVDLVIGPGYSGASVPLVLFALGAAVNLPGSVISSALQASGRQRQVTILGVVLLILQMLSLVLLVKLFSINGAAAAILLTYIAQLLVVVFLYRRHGDGA